MKNKKGSFLITTGLLLTAAALCLLFYNLWDDRRAGLLADETAAQLAAEMPAADNSLSADSDALSSGEEEIPDHILNPDMEMPVKTVDGWDYIGLLEIPSLELSLPVISQWSYPALKVSPCRYEGSAYKDNLIIAAHNYKTHFRALPELPEGEQILFTDMDGNVFTYEVIVRETLMPTDVEEMSAGDWDLTLFTCINQGKYRFTVRCQKITDTAKTE